MPFSHASMETTRAPSRCIELSRAGGRGRAPSPSFFAGTSCRSRSTAVRPPRGREARRSTDLGPPRACHNRSDGSSDTTWTCSSETPIDSTSSKRTFRRHGLPHASSDLGRALRIDRLLASSGLVVHLSLMDSRSKITRSSATDTAALVGKDDPSTGSACRASTRAPASPRFSATRRTGDGSSLPKARSER